MTLLAVGLAFGLAGCDTTDGDLFGDDATAVAANGCTPSGCPQAAGFCQARGYRPGTDRYQRCLVSVEENLRRGR